MPHIAQEHNFMEGCQHGLAKGSAQAQTKVFYGVASVVHLLHVVGEDR